MQGYNIPSPCAHKFQKLINDKSLWAIIENFTYFAWYELFPRPLFLYMIKLKPLVHTCMFVPIYDALKSFNSIFFTYAFLQISNISIVHGRRHLCTSRGHPGTFLLQSLGFKTRLVIKVKHLQTAKMAFHTYLITICGQQSKEDGVSVCFHSLVLQ